MNDTSEPVAPTSKTSNFDCSHPGFDVGGVCTCCREFYSAEHDQNPNDIHPAMARLVARAKARSEQSTMRTLGKALADLQRVLAIDPPLTGHDAQCMGVLLIDEATKRLSAETRLGHDDGTTRLAIAMLERFRDGRLQTAEGTHTSLLGPRDQLLQEADWFDHAAKVLRSTVKAAASPEPHPRGRCKCQFCGEGFVVWGDTAVHERSCSKNPANAVNGAGGQS